MNSSVRKIFGADDDDDVDVMARISRRTMNISAKSLVYSPGRVIASFSNER